MNKILRDGVDIRIALLSNIKRLILSSSISNSPHNSTPSVQKDPNVDVKTQGITGDPIQTQTSGYFWKFFRLGYRKFIKPILRPFATRVKFYLIAGLRQEILHEISQLLAVTSRESQSVRDSLRQEIENSSKTTQQEIKKASTTTSQKLRIVRDSLHQEFTNALQSSQHEFHQVSEAASRDLQSVRDSLRQEIENSSKTAQQEIQKASTTAAQELQALNAGHLSRLNQIEEYSYATARRVVVSCDSGEVLIKTAVGYMVCSASDYALLACLIDTGDLELGTRLLIQRFIKAGDVFVDVGANIGIHTLAAARAMEGQGKLIAFEPFEPTKRMLEKTLWINGFTNITEIHQAAVSNISGHRSLYLGRTSGHHSLFPLKDDANHTQSTVEVPVVRLDESIPSDQKIDLMKIDVEGAELEVIESGSSLILKNPNIALIVEFGPEHLRRTKCSFKKWINTFTKLGLTYRVINTHTGILEKWTTDQLKQVVSVNLFFSRDDSLAWSRLDS